MTCPFCDNQELDYRLIHKDKLVMAFPTNISIVPGHTLICPVRHVSKIDELTDDELIALKQLIIKIKNSLAKSYKAEGFNLAWNEGETAGQSVNHLHVHVLPRKSGDSGVYQYEPREFLYWKELRDKSSEQELNKVAELIKKSL